MTDFIDEMVKICVDGDVVTPANAEYLRRNLVQFLQSHEAELTALRARVAEFEYAVNAGNTARHDVPADTLSKWFRYVYTGEK